MLSAVISSSFFFSVREIYNNGTFKYKGLKN